MIRNDLRVVVAGALMLGVASVAALAHEGHLVMGTVSSVCERHIELKTADGKATLEISVNEKTTFLRGRTRSSKEDIKVGERIVVVLVADDPPLIAKEVRLAPIKSTAPPKR